MVNIVCGLMFLVDMYICIYFINLFLEYFYLFLNRIFLFIWNVGFYVNNEKVKNFNILLNWLILYFNISSNYIIGNEYNV